jgi:hypothetical protein
METVKASAWQAGGVSADKYMSVKERFYPRGETNESHATRSEVIGKDMKTITGQSKSTVTMVQLHLYCGTLI